MPSSVKVQLVVLLALTLVALGIWYAAGVTNRAGILTVSFMNVGQGDAIFIDAPSGRQVLIDGGKGRGVLRELANAMPWFDRSIDVVVATHPDQDHIGGLPDVLKRYRISYIVESSVKDEGGSDAAALESAAASEEATGAVRIVAVRGQIIDLGEGAHLEILFPDRDVAHVETNTGSVVARVVYGATAFMLTGDAPQNIEEYLARLDPHALKANVLKVGHHGSKTSSAPLFVGFVQPEYAVFSRGCDNRYGHPAPEVVALYERFEIPTLDTCEDGTVTLVSDGLSVKRR